MGQAQINVRTRACSRTSIARTKQAALTHNVRGKELINPRNIISNIIMIFNINSTRGQTRFLTCVARVTCLELDKYLTTVV